jgi:hypothetical protein
MVVDHIKSISVMLRVLVEELRVFIDLPENHLSVKTARDNSIFGILIET